MAVIDKKSPIRRRPAGMLRRWRVAARKLLRDQRGTTSLEWALLLGAIALPAVYLMTMCLGVIIDYYRMMTMISSLPCP